MSFSLVPVKSPYAEVLDRWFDHQNSLYVYGPGQCVMPLYFSDYAQDILDFEVRKDDVWVVSFPRAGSTWSQEMAWLIGNDLDFEAASSTMQQLRAPMIEMSVYFREHEDFCKLIGNSVDYVKNKASPRYIKTHLPLKMLPKQLATVKPKIIYVARNPKDLCVSYYHHMQLMHNMRCKFEEMAELFCEGMVPIGSVWNHYLPFWAKRNDENVLFLKYEDIKRHTKLAIGRIADFLGKTLNEEQVDAVYNFLSFEKMKDNPGMNMTTFVETCRKLGYDVNSKGIIRKGKIGDWKNYMTPEISKTYDEWIEENTKGTELSFD